MRQLPLPSSNEVISEASPRYSVLGNGTLTIAEVQDDDEGFYECRASNPMGEAVSRPAKVSMQHIDLPNSECGTPNLTL